MSSEDILREDVPRESGSESDKDSIASLDEETTKEDKNAQEWLEENYEKKKEVEEIKRWGKKISGKLIIADFPQLKVIDVNSFLCSDEEKLTQLHLRNCPQLTYLDCSCNKLTELIITNCPNFTNIEVYNNEITEMKGLADLPQFGRVSLW